jgi:hypothetical protein
MNFSKGWEYNRSRRTGVVTMQMPEEMNVLKSVKKKVCILGGGSYGTVIARVLG